MAKIATLKFIDRVLEERDRLYGARFDAAQTAVTAALAAQKELTSAAFLSSEKAIVKAEGAQHSYNTTHNDLSRKMDQQYERMMPRAESLALHDATKDRLAALEKDLKEKISAVEKMLVQGAGKSAGLSAGWGYLVGAIGLALGLYMAFRP